MSKTRISFNLDIREIWKNKIRDWGVWGGLVNLGGLRAVWGSLGSLGGLRGSWGSGGIWWGLGGLGEGLGRSGEVWGGLGESGWPYG